MSGGDVVIHADIALIALDGGRKVLYIVIGNCVRRSGVRQREQIFEHGRRERIYA